ncbi:MAG TPA: ATPase [Dehalococcoidia bacterium]|nr:ATPase [Dehalococcoidia bacterium]
MGNRKKETKPQQPQWYQLTAEEVFRTLGTGQEGLSANDVEERLLNYGYNELDIKKPGILRRFLRQFNNPLVYVLLIAAAITGILTLRGEHMLPDTIVIVAVVILNVLLGFIQEGKTESALEALRGMIVRECTVIREGDRKVIPARELVPGDIVLVSSGDRVPADLRLFMAKNVDVDESALTGESVPVRKNIEAIAKDNLSPGDQQCIVFSGTFLTHGSARGIVTETAGNTEFGKIARLVGKTKKTATPLQRKIADFTKTLMICIFVLGGINFLLGYIFGFTFSYSFIATIALIVAAMPEMLPMLVTSILALSASVMARRNALIRLLPAAETLGSTTVICSDKTGTLTKNEMTVISIYAGGRTYSISGIGYQPAGEFSIDGKKIESVFDHAALVETLKAGVLCNNAALRQNNGRYEVIGDPTEGALIAAAAKAGITGDASKLDEIPFESERMYMAILIDGESNNILYVKGSPEVILKMCRDESTDSGVESLHAESILAEADRMGEEGLRLLGMAFATLPKEHKTIEIAHIENLTFAGLQGMIDPPREEVIEAVRLCKKAGIRPVMITGDHIKTARAIALQLGIIGSEADKALSGEQLATLSDDELYKQVNHVSVYARVAPEHKLRIAQQLQRSGEIVAMTGDGVNDAPALRAANIGIAMGITGTEISKEAADIVLTDDNFASIVAAVEEGRHAWNNIEKAILYTLPTNGGQALLIMAAILLAPFIALFATRLPLEPIQILWINLFDSVFLTMPLMMEPKEKDLLSLRPRDPKARLANTFFFERVGLVSIVMAAIGFITYWELGHLALAADDRIVIGQAQTAAFMSVVAVHLGYVLTARSTLKSAFSINLLSNKWLLGGIVITVVTDLLIVYVPSLNGIFKTMPFPAHWWLFVLAGLLAGFLVPELEKFVRRRLQRAGK